MVRSVDHGRYISSVRLTVAGGVTGSGSSVSSSHDTKARAIIAPMANVAMRRMASGSDEMA